MSIIVVFGKNGQVGYELTRTLSTMGDIIAIDIEECDLTRPESILRFLNENKPRMIVNSAAYTAVDKAESEPEIAHKINSIAPSVMAEWAKSNDAILVHYSTDYVFDGTKNSPWTEDDSPNPLNVYGKTKLAGDDAIQKSGCEYLIFRTSWVYGARGKNFYLTMRKLLSEKEEIKVVNDQIGAPTWSRAIAEATAQVLVQVFSPASTLKIYSGIYNMTNSGSTSWFGFTEAIRNNMIIENPQQLNLARVIPIPGTEYPTPAKRPQYSCLNCNKLFNTFGIKLSEWSVDLHKLYF